MNESVFLQHIRENQGIIYKLVSLYARDEDEKEDMYQEIILQAWKGWPSFRQESRFSTWLYRISLNTLLTAKRRKKIVDYRDNLEALPHAVDPDAGSGEEARRLHMAIRALPETEKALVSLHLDGYGHAEIAEIVGISENHVAVKLHRIKTKLKDQLNS